MVAPRKINAWLRAVLTGTGLFFAAVLGAAIGFGGGVPLVPPSPNYSEASQIVGTLNAFVNQLNGNAAGAGGYAAQPGGVISLGSFGTAAGATPITLNTQRGLATSTGVTVAGASSTVVSVNDSLLTASSICEAHIATFSGTYTTNGLPSIAQVLTGAGAASFVIINAHATNSTGSQSFGIAYNCVN